MHIVYAQFYTDKPTPDYECLAHELRGLGHSVWMLGLDHDGNVVLEDGNRARILFTDPRQYNLGAYSRLPLLSSLCSRLLGFLLILRLRSYLKQQSPDIVQVDPAAVNWVWLLPLGMPPVTKYILDSRQTGLMASDSRLGKVLAWMKNQKRPFYARNFFDRTTFLHDAGAERVLGARWKKWASVVPMGVNSEFLEYNLVENRAFSDSPVRFLYIGRLSKIRKLERILHAAQLLKEFTSDFLIHFIGIDETAGFYNGLIEELDLSDNVSILPPVPYTEIGNVIAAYDVMLAYVPETPSDWMYHPTLKVIEYSAMGAPIIATDFAPNRAIVNHEKNGLLVENRPQAFAAAMRKFIDEPDFLEMSYLEGQKTRYSITWHEVAQMYLKDVYQPLVKSNAANDNAVRGASLTI